MFQSDNLGHGNPRDDLRPAALISLVAEDRLHSNGHEATHSRKSQLCLVCQVEDNKYVLGAGTSSRLEEVK